MNSSEEQVILVDQHDQIIGTMGKMQAHREGALHRAFSVFIFNSAGEILLQRRASGKYHSAGLWTNTCCSHPRPGERVADAAVRRLKEEMGMTCVLSDLFSFTYRSEFDDGLIEYEVDHVFVGHSDAAPAPDSSEVSETRSAAPDAILKDLVDTPELFTTWFRLCFERVLLDIRSRESPSVD